MTTPSLSLFDILRIERLSYCFIFPLFPMTLSFDFVDNLYYNEAITSSLSGILGKLWSEKSCWI